MSHNQSYLIVVGIIEEVLNTVTGTDKTNVSEIDDQRAVDIESNKNFSTTSDGKVEIDTDIEEDSSNIKDINENPEGSIEPTSAVEETKFGKMSPTNEVYSQLDEVNSKEEFIQAIELSPTPTVTKSGNGVIELSQQSLHKAEKKGTVEVHFDSPIASFHEYYISQDTCESTQSLSDLTPIASPDKQQSSIADDIGNIEMQQTEQIFTEHYMMSTLMTPAGDCTTQQLAAELSGATEQVTYPNNDDENERSDKYQNCDELIRVTEKSTSMTEVTDIEGKLYTVNVSSNQESNEKPYEHYLAALESSPDLFDSSPLTSKSNISDTMFPQNENSEQLEETHVKNCDENNINLLSDAMDDNKCTFDSDNKSEHSSELKDVDDANNSNYKETSVDVIVSLEKHIVNVEGSPELFSQIKDSDDTDQNSYQKLASMELEASLEKKKNETASESKIKECDIECMDTLISNSQTTVHNDQGTIQQTSAEDKDISCEDPRNEIIPKNQIETAKEDTATKKIICEIVLIGNSKHEERCCKRSISPDHAICSVKKIKTQDDKNEPDKIKPKKRTLTSDDVDIDTNLLPVKHPKLCTNDLFVHSNAANQYYQKELKHLAAKVLSNLDEETEWETSAAHTKNLPFYTIVSEKLRSSCETEIDAKTDIKESNDHNEDMEIVDTTNEICIEKGETETIKDNSCEKFCDEHSKVYPFKFSNLNIEASRKIDDYTGRKIDIDNESEISTSNEQSSDAIEKDTKVCLDLVPQEAENNDDLETDKIDKDIENNESMAAMKCLTQSLQKGIFEITTDQSQCLERQSLNQDSIQYSQEKFRKIAISETADIPIDDMEDGTAALQNVHTDGDLDNTTFITAMEYLSQSSQGSSTGFLVDKTNCAEPQSSSQESIQPSQANYIEIAISEKAEIPTEDIDLPEEAELYIQPISKDMDANVDTEVLDIYVSRAIDDLVPDEDTADEDNSDNGSLYQKEEENAKDKKFYSCDVDMYDDTDKLVCSPVDKQRCSEPTTSSTTGCFKWKYAPSYHSDKPISELDDEDKMVTINPIKTCNKPIRLGLSKKNKPLQRLHKF